MPKKTDEKFQKKLSELEKFIGSVLNQPMNPDVKKKILNDLHSYKAKLLERQNDPHGFHKTPHPWGDSKKH